MTEINNTIEKSPVKLTREDFVSDQMVKWCPGCGDHAILAAVSKVFPEIGYKKENFVFVSGIGCSSRFPYYVNTYGFHSIHGRATPIASGVKIANPKLSVWIVTGDGDSMAIGGNHFIHIIRRNIDVNLLLLNNRIYGLTKGQYSPTSPLGSITKTSPYGTIEHPFNPGELVLGAQGTFYARALDVNPKLMTEIMFEAARHDGTSVVEVLQNCVIFNDGAYDEITDKAVREDRTILLRAGEKMIFGTNRNKGLHLQGTSLEVVTVGENGITEDDLLVHDPYQADPGIHLMLAKMSGPDFPVALGVIRSAKCYPTYDDLMEEQIAEISAKSKIHCMDDLLMSGDTWTV
ncbi:MAG TPA: 2-oxoacid:ferredoxin oxidoreductase subunit beta [Bacteroidales bacterium]|nr:MAG: 2-oxoacid:ferredoxin oxidoreductase subunit beta [Bacteroidetes bacterium GWE2_42_24]OFY29178.1 MAG: 2-oxoacid:ferredoxin oxidoreductase subunit beta [Bacteroidetes bacterium GWF2_43_11]HAQ65540.1 2-oxoacid:ferredoxin oxidoreductase subunit beta [Bacteroidales bacterium]HBZ66843.1 2-oxoacid:ferredoxin oxidoreductase subunit beta [Bacteroidales bacterium]